MNTKHTPTPWLVGRKVSNQVYARHGMDIIAQCDTMNEESRATENANAAFIVRACNAYDQNQQTIADLVEALEKIDLLGNGIEIVEARDDSLTAYATLMRCGKLARAALAKAKGEA